MSTGQLHGLRSLDIKEGRRLGHKLQGRVYDSKIAGVKQGLDKYGNR
jgi:hypothetical protein